MHRNIEEKKEYERLRGVRRREYFRDYQRKRLECKPRQPGKIYVRTSLGYEGEQVGLKVLLGSKKINRPCDLSWNGKLVDVKTAMPTKTNRGTNRWKFLLEKQKDTVDLYLLIRKGSDKRIIDLHLIPNWKKKNISFSDSTAYKYARYLLTL